MFLIILIAPPVDIIFIGYPPELAFAPSDKPGARAAIVGVIGDVECETYVRTSLRFTSWGHVTVAAAKVS